MDDGAAGCDSYINDFSTVLIIKDSSHKEVDETMGSDNLTIIISNFDNWQ